MAEDIKKIKLQIIHELNNNIVNVKYKNNKIGYHEKEEDIK